MGYTGGIFAFPVRYAEKTLAAGDVNIMGRRMRPALDGDIP
jgi:hypothetical protein